MDELRVVAEGQVDLQEVKEKAEQEAYKKVGAILNKSKGIERITLALLAIGLIGLSIQVAILQGIYNDHSHEQLQISERSRSRNAQALNVLRDINEHLKAALPTNSNK